MRLTGRRALITGASKGLGYAIARAYLDEGASVALCARGAEQLVRAERELGVRAIGDAKVVAIPADVSNEDQVRGLVDRAIEALGGLDVLVSNAGIYGPKGPIDDISWSEWSQAIAINLLGTVLCCRAVVPHFKRQQHGRIVVLSGGGATKPMPYLSAYAASKAGVVRFAETLAEEVRSHGITVNAVAPGALNTGLLDEVLTAGPDRVGRAFYEQSLNQQREGGTPLDVGASLCVALAAKDASSITGKLISAVWDPWERFPEKEAELARSDVYTLRRIVPEDRGVRWE